MVASEMQPGCLDHIHCHLEVNNVSALVRVLNRYVTSMSDQAPIAVPRAGCSVMASPGAVAGRWPHGLAQKATRLFLNQSANVRNATAQLVHPLSLTLAELFHRPTSGEEPHRAQSPAGKEASPPLGSISMLKIDTEGYEIRVLESIRPLWSRICAIVVELQPSAWRFSNVSAQQGLSTLRELITGDASSPDVPWALRAAAGGQKRRQGRRLQWLLRKDEQSDRGDDFLVATLPHAVRNDNGPVAHDVCTISELQPASVPMRPQVGVSTARLYHGSSLLPFVQMMLQVPGKYGWFHEVLLLRRSTLSQQCGPSSARHQLR